MKLYKLIGLCMLLFIVVLLSSQVYALGLRPARTELTYEPGISKLVKFKIVNDEHRDLDLILYAEGPFSDIIKFEQTSIKIPSDYEYAEVSFRINMPQELLPGEHIIKIVVQEEIPYVVIGKSYMKARIRLVHKVIITVPYPEKYVSAKIDVLSTEEHVVFKAKVKNLGKLPIQGVSAKFDVIEADKKIASVKTGKETLEISERKELAAQIPKSRLGSGEYELISSILYDENSFELIKPITVDEPSISLALHNLLFAQGRINELSIGLRSNWNKPIEAYIELDLKKGSKSIFQSQSPSLTIMPGREKRTTLYLDARGLEPGSYTANIKALYQDKSVSKNFDVEIVPLEEYKSAIAKQLPATPQTHIYVLTALIAIVGIILILILKRLSR